MGWLPLKPVAVGSTSEVCVLTYNLEPWDIPQISLSLLFDIRTSNLIDWLLFQIRFYNFTSFELKIITWLFYFEDAFDLTLGVFLLKRALNRWTEMELASIQLISRRKHIWVFQNIVKFWAWKMRVLISGRLLITLRF